MKIIRKTLGEEIYRSLLDELMSGALPGGSRLCEEKICKQLGVSRTPLREALIRLLREGILEKRSSGGCIVRKMSPDSLAELFEARGMLECLALREYFDRIDISGMKLLKKALLDAKRKGSREDTLRADERMHELITEACKNSCLAEEIRGLQLRCRPYRIHRCFKAEDVRAAVAERLRIIDAILAGDSGKAEEGMKEHFQCGIKHYRDKLKKGN